VEAGPVHTDVNPMYTLVLLRFTEVCRLAVLTYWGDVGALLPDQLAEKGRPGLRDAIPARPAAGPAPNPPPIAPVGPFPSDRLFAPLLKL
jgi:hypothetical protein